MKILAMDTAQASCSVALWQDGQVSVHEFQDMNRGHASELLPMIDRVLKQASLKVADLDALAVSVGPGAFTGLRIGLASARGFGVASGLPVIGVTTLEALSHGVSHPEHPVLCALDAKRADLYAQFFDAQGKALCDPVARLPEDVAKMAKTYAQEIIVAGDSFDRLAPFLAELNIKAHQSDVRMPDARYIVEIAALKGLPPRDQARPSAFYIRPPDAAIPKNGGRLRP